MNNRSGPQGRRAGSEGSSALFETCSNSAPITGDSLPGRGSEQEGTAVFIGLVTQLPATGYAIAPKQNKHETFKADLRETQEGEQNRTQRRR